MPSSKGKIKKHPCEFQYTTKDVLEWEKTSNTPFPHPDMRCHNSAVNYPKGCKGKYARYCVVHLRKVINEEKHPLGKCRYVIRREQRKCGKKCKNVFKIGKTDNCLQRNCKNFAVDIVLGGTHVTTYCKTHATKIFKGVK